MPINENAGINEDRKQKPWATVHARDRTSTHAQPSPRGRREAAGSWCRGSASFWGAEGAPILFSDLGLRMASCSYIYIYIHTTTTTTTTQCK